MANTFLIKYDEVNRIARDISKELNTLEDNLNDCIGYINILLLEPNFKGKAANSIKAYMQDFHINMMNSLILATRDLNAVVQKYKRGYLSIDSNTGFVIDESKLNNLKNCLQDEIRQFDDDANNVDGVVNSICDIISFKNVTRFNIEKQYEKIITSIDTLEQSVRSFEAAYVADINSTIVPLLQFLLSYLQDKEIVNRGDLDKYVAGSVSLGTNKDFFVTRQVVTDHIEAFEKERLSEEGYYSSAQSEYKSSASMHIGEDRYSYSIYGAHNYYSVSPGMVSGSVLYGKAETNSEIMGINVDASAEGDLLGYSAEYTAEAKADWKNGDVSVEVGGKAEAHVAHGKASASIGYLDTDVEGTLLGAEVSGSVGASLFTNGKFTPSLKADAEAKAYVAQGKAKTSFGVDDYNVHAAAKGTVLGAEAKAGAQAGIIDVDTDGDGEVDSTTAGAKAKVGAEAYVAKGTVSGGITIFGMEIDINVTGKAVSVGATAEAEVTGTGARGKVGLSFLLGADVEISVDWSNVFK